jgi:hypothetical protein
MTTQANVKITGNRTIRIALVLGMVFTGTLAIIIAETLLKPTAMHVASQIIMIGIGIGVMYKLGMLKTGVC